MNEEFNELEEAIRERLVRASIDVLEVDPLRSRVLAALEADADVHTQERSFWTRNRRTAGLLLGAAATIAAAVAFVPEQPDQTVVVTVDEPPNAATRPPAAEAPDVFLQLSEINETLTSDPLHEELGTWTVESETEHVLTLEFVSDTAQVDAPKQYLRIVVPSSSTTTDEVVDSLTSSLFDTMIVDDEASLIGGVESRALRLETVEGTTQLGFKLAADTYIKTEGTNRVFVVHITAVREQTVSFWLEAAPADIAEFEQIASRLIERLHRR